MQRKIIGGIRNQRAFRSGIQFQYVDRRIFEVQDSRPVNKIRKAETLNHEILGAAEPQPKCKNKTLNHESHENHEKKRTNIVAKRGKASSCSPSCTRNQTMGDTGNVVLVARAQARGTVILSEASCPPDPGNDKTCCLGHPQTIGSVMGSQAESLEISE